MTKSTQHIIILFLFIFVYIYIYLYLCCLVVLQLNSIDSYVCGCYATHLFALTFVVCASAQLSTQQWLRYHCCTTRLDSSRLDIHYVVHNSTQHILSPGSCCPDSSFLRHHFHTVGTVLM